MNLNLKIEKLLSKNLTDLEVSKEIKSEIKTYINSLNQLFEKDQGKSFLVKHTKSIDSFIKTIFKYSLRKHFGEYIPMINTLPVTIVSLGSYAREQLCVYSDIDIMIVYKDIKGYNLKPLIEIILHICWDSGLKIAHRVHEIDQLQEAANSDHTIKTAILESRYLCGSKYLWTEIENKLKVIRKEKQHKYIVEKLREREDRIKKYPFNMEPNIKSSVGSLRDVNTLFWISNALFNLSKIKDLTPTIIPESDYSSLMSSVEYLYRIRAALHLSAGKKQDNLRLEYIPDIALKLKLSQRKVVEKTFEAMVKIESVTQYLIYKISHHIINKQKPFSQLKGYRLQKNIFIVNDNVCMPLSAKIKNLDYFIDNFISMEDKNYKFQVTYIHALQNTTNNEFKYKKIKSLFYRKYLYNFFMALYKSKKLYIIFAPLKKVAHLPQFDGYHKYPVDIHSIRTLLALENIDDIYIRDLFYSLSDDEKALIKVVTFLHDCGKGRKKDHSKLGAVIVKNTLLAIGFSEEDAKVGYKLVSYHTLMSNISNREDIYSQKVIYNFIAKLNSLKVLKLLYILTYADIDSVGKGTYSNFNANLLHELYLSSAEAFENTNMITEAQKRIKKERVLKKSKEFKELPYLLKKKIISIESNLLFFKYKPHTIVSIANWVYNLKNEFDFKITVYNSLVIEIVRKKNINLGYLLGKLSSFNVASMDIFKIFNNTKYFKIEFFEKADEDMIFFIKEVINNSLDMSKKITLKKPTMKQDEITIDCNHTKSYASMQINTKDSPQIMANIMATFDDIGIDIASAKIQTIKKRARNLFLIEKNGKLCKNRDEVIKRLTTN